MEQKDGGGCVLITDVPSTKETIVVKDDHVVGMVQMFESCHDFDIHVSLDMQTQLHTRAQKLASGSKMTMSTNIPKGGMTNFRHVVAPREVNFESLVLDMSNLSLHHLIISKTWYLLVFDVNGLLCVAQHLKFTKAWKPLVLAI